MSAQKTQKFSHERKPWTTLPRDLADLQLLLHRAWGLEAGPKDASPSRSIFSAGSASISSTGHDASYFLCHARLWALICTPGGAVLEIVRGEPAEILDPRHACVGAHTTRAFRTISDVLFGVSAHACISGRRFGEALGSTGAGLTRRGRGRCSARRRPACRTR